MAKPNIHPKMNNLTLKIGKDEFATMSAYHKTELLVDIDFRKHPAWTGKGSSTVSESNKSVNKFNQRFGASGGIFG